MGKEESMIRIRNVNPSEKRIIDEIVSIHLSTFTGFFLTFMGRGFLRQLYSSYCENKKSGLLVAMVDEKCMGFLAYSGDLSGLYKHMLKSRIIQFAWYSLGAFLRKPAAFLHIVRAFLKPSESKRTEKYVELASIGVSPSEKSKGIGSQLVDALKNKVNFSEYAYITLETDAENNDVAIRFYEKNGFTKERQFETSEGRKMFEYRYSN